jgi:predicted nucleotidyltransferase
VARAVGRSQPEVARLERFSGTTKRAKALMTHRTELRQLAGAAGFTNLRVFGSVARGQDTDASDIDILFDYEDTPSLMRIARVERRAAQLLGTPVDLVPAADLRPGPASTALEEAIPL